MPHPPPPRAPRTARLAADDGQSAVELVAVLPIVVVLAAALWQAVVGGDAKAAARRALPGALEPGLRVEYNDEGKAKVHIAIPLVVGSGSLTTVTAQAHFQRQDG